MITRVISHGFFPECSETLERSISWPLAGHPREPLTYNCPVKNSRQLALVVTVQFVTINYQATQHSGAVPLLVQHCGVSTMRNKKK